MELALATHRLRLSQASFAAYKPSADWTAEVNAFNESLSYDLNGNILALRRNKTKAGTAVFSVVSDTYGRPRLYVREWQRFKLSVNSETDLLYQPLLFGQNRDFDLAGADE